MRIFGFALFLLLVAPAYGLHTYLCKPGDKLFVLAQSGLRLRQAAQTGAVLASIPYGQAVVFAPQNYDEQVYDSVENMMGDWIKVTYEGKTGFVFSQFLSFLPAPSSKCTSMLDYLNEAFKPTAPPLMHKKLIGDELTETDTLRTYVYGNGYLAIFSNDHGYESYSDHVVFYNVSPEEVWLLAQACYKHEIGEARKRLEMMKKGLPMPDDCQPSVDLAEINQLSLSQFNWNRDKPNEQMDIDLLACNCFEGISIQSLWYMVVFSFGGGC